MTEDARIDAELRRLGFKQRIHRLRHHVSHASSAFFPSGFDRAAILTIDGVGEWTTTTLGHGDALDITLKQQLTFPHSLGLLYMWLTEYLGFEMNEGEYKVMGLAAYGTPRYSEQLRELIQGAPDGTFKLDTRYFPRRHRERFISLFGPAREPNSPIDAHHADIASSLQAVVEGHVLQLAREARRSTGLSKLCLAGGVAYNGVANGLVLRESGFRDVFVPPAAGDAGGALGAALYGLHALHRSPRRPALRDARLGPTYDSDVATWLNRRGIAAKYYEDGDLVEAVADLLDARRVVGWVRGRMEYGPRALGARSILARPHPAAMRDLVNEKIKWREPFRPFAPAVTIEDASRYFEIAGPSPFMTFVVPVRQEARDALQAVTHVDGTARVQTVESASDPAFYRLLRCAERRWGLPIVLNTSLNVRGEPIVRTLDEAFECFSRTALDALVLGNYLLGADSKRR